MCAKSVLLKDAVVKDKVLLAPESLWSARKWEVLDGQTSTQSSHLQISFLERNSTICSCGIEDVDISLATIHLEEQACLINLCVNDDHLKACFKIHLPKDAVDLKELES